MNYTRFCDEIVAQSELLAGQIADAELTTEVPTCPGWNVGQLVRHIDGGHRWAEELVRTRATEPISDVALRDLSPFESEDPAQLAPVLRQGAEALRDTLVAAGPDASMWAPVAGGGSAFYARRFTHETVVHRADAALALGASFALDPDVAADGIEEWLELGSLPFHFEVHPSMRELLAPGRTIGLRATDADLNWVVDLTGAEISWRRGDDGAAVTVSGPLTELLLVIYKRRPPVAVAGDRELLDFWLQRVDFG
ncbi:MAG: maleylpyruvate isomerase family mycothiol-dependent enzyme [Mycobacterium sp.]